MKKILGLSLVGMFAMSLFVASPAMADDNKIVEASKALGKGIMWAPKKLWEGTKKGMTAMGNGAKKMMGKS